MQTKTADVSRGVAWFTGGWRLFMKNPGVWVVLGAIFIASLFVLALIPLEGATALGFGHLHWYTTQKTLPWVQPVYRLVRSMGGAPASPTCG